MVSELLTRRLSLGEAWNLPEPISQSDVSFPLTPALSPEEREKSPPR